jgi:hypothetical protein
MWPTLWLFAMVPILGVLLTVDSAAHLSQIIGSSIGLRRRPDLAILIFAAVCLVGVFLVLLPHLAKMPAELVEYVNTSDVRTIVEREKVQHIFSIVDFLLVVFSMSVVFYVARRSGKSPVIWLLIALIGNFGAVVWILSNRLPTRKVDG